MWQVGLEVFADHVPVHVCKFGTEYDHIRLSGFRGANSRAPQFTYLDVEISNFGYFFDAVDEFAIIINDQDEFAAHRCGVTRIRR